jgi:hypothetical protein
VKVLSVRAPWAQFLVRGTAIATRALPPARPDFKDVENRGWEPHEIEPGDRFAIHCGLKADAGAMVLFGVRPEAVADDLGRVIGSVRLLTVRPWRLAGASRSVWHAPDMVGWYVGEPREWKKRAPLRGRLGLFEVDLDDERERVCE